MQEQENVDYGQQFEEEFSKIKDNIKKPNIFVTGGTGVGKSALINLIFGEEKAEVGAGLPVTNSIAEYSNESITIYDSAGYESGETKQQEYENEIINFIKSREGKTIEEQIHIVWYCISAPGHRVLPIDLEIIKNIKAHCPVAVVLTQVDAINDEEADELKKVIIEDISNIDIFETSKDAKTNPSLVQFNGDDLVQWSIDNLDDGLKPAFIASLKTSLETKRNNGLKIIAGFATSAGAIGAIPIPLSDAPLLVSNQLAMVASLAYNWDLPMSSVIKAAGASGLASTLGRSVAGALLKLLPIVGSVINAGVATTFTTAIGYAINEVCYRIANDQINGKVLEIAEYFGEDILKTLTNKYLKDSKDRESKDEDSKNKDD